MPAEPSPEDLAFARVPLESFERCEGSPVFPKGEIGIRLAAPRRVRAGERSVVVPVCAAASYDHATRDAWPDALWPSITAVVVDAAGTFAAAAPLEEDSPPAFEDPGEPPEAEGSEPAETPANLMFEECYNFDLARYVPIPARPGVYFVFLTIDRTHSNTVRIEVLPPERWPRGETKAASETVEGGPK